MSIQVVSNEHNAALFCSTTMTAFGHVDDLERMAKTGEVRCPDCGEWTEPIEADFIKGIRARRRCDDCHDEFLRDQEAERKGDQMREEGL